MADKKLKYEVNYVTKHKSEGLKESVVSLEKYKNLQLQVSRLEERINKQTKKRGGSVVEVLSKQASSTGRRVGWNQNVNPAAMGRMSGNILSYTVEKLLGTIGDSNKEGRDRSYRKTFGGIGYKMGSLAGKDMGITGGKAGAKIGQGISTMVGLLGTLTGLAAMALPAIIALVVASSRMLQKTLGNILKFIMLFIRPIGDMLAVLMYPLMMTLRPLALLINTTLRPFLKTARDWYRVGLQQQGMARRAERAGYDEDTVDSLNAMAQTSFGEGTNVLGLGFSTLFSGLMAGVVEQVTNTLFKVVELIPGVGVVAENVKNEIIEGIHDWRDGVQETNQLALINSQKELEGAKLVNTHLNGYISLAETMKSNGDDFKKVIEDTTPAIKAVADAYVNDSAIAAAKIAKDWTDKTTLMIANIDSVSTKSQKMWNSHLENIDKATEKFKEMYNQLDEEAKQITIDMPAERPEGNLLTQLAGYGAKIGLMGGDAAIQAIKALGYDLTNENYESNLALAKEIANAMAQGYTREQILAGSYKSREMTVEQRDEYLGSGAIDTEPFKLLYTNLGDVNTNLTNTISSVNGLKGATDLLAGDTGFGDLKLKTDDYISGLGTLTEDTASNTESIVVNTNSMNLFKESTVDAISAIDTAVTQAKNFAADAAAAAARASAISKMSKDSEGEMAIGGSIDQNGMYYLHRGETVTNPVDSSFKNTSGGSGGGNITINMQGSTFGNFNEWKREMDKYFSQQMRHMR